MPPSRPSLASSSPPPSPPLRFATFAWAVVAYNLAVIVWGGYVRASGSGAGCGRHWPTCNGDVVPRAPQVATMIEFFHRVTSGLALVAVVALAVAAFRSFPRGHRVRRGALWSVGFVMGEALIGAGLVLFELVAHDASMKRALSMALHLTNTFFLLGALALTAVWASGGAALRLRRQGAALALLVPAFAGMFLLGTSGAIAALGDTLFPARTLAEGIAQDASPAAHAFLRLRILHPFLAVITGGLVLLAAFAARYLRRTPRVVRASRVVTVAFLLQFSAGIVNLLLLAPVWMQLTHLLFADLVWVALVILAAATLAEDADVARPAPALEPHLASTRPIG